MNALGSLGGAGRFLVRWAMTRRTQRSAEAAKYRRWYSTARWQRIRARQLQREPLCRFCQQKGRITAATVCDHVTPHKGNKAIFWGGPFQSLCAPCHNGTKQQIERLGYSTEIAPDGWPADPRHPANRQR